MRSSQNNVNQLQTNWYVIIIKLYLYSIFRTRVAVQSALHKINKSKQQEQYRHTHSRQLYLDSLNTKHTHHAPRSPSQHSNTHTHSTSEHTDTEYSQTAHNYLGSLPAS